VARENLGQMPALMAAAALMVDYVLVVAVGISAGVGALVSAFPSLQPHMLALCLAILAGIALVNLRGVRESGLAFVVPTYLFIVSLFGVIVLGLARMLLAGGRPTPVVAPPLLPAALAHAHPWLLMTAFASGCSAMTGVEAVSNGVTAFQKPGVVLARRTLTAIVFILALLLAGIALLARAYGIGATQPGRSGYESIMSQLVAAVVGRGAFYYVTIGSVLAVLALSANTGFADFPRLCRIVALDNFLPHAFATMLTSRARPGTAGRSICPSCARPSWSCQSRGGTR
jgi:amino acid transporter